MSPDVAVEIVGAVSEFAGGSIRDADLPSERFAFARHFPDDIRRQLVAADLDLDILPRVLTNRAIGEGVKGVGTRANVRNGKMTRCIRFGPILIIIGLELPVPSHGRLHETDPGV